MLPTDEWNLLAFSTIGWDWVGFASLFTIRLSPQE
jgi:hypothetical protein